MLLNMKMVKNRTSLYFQDTYTMIQMCSLRLKILVMAANCDIKDDALISEGFIFKRVTICVIFNIAVLGEKNGRN